MSHFTFRWNFPADTFVKQNPKNKDMTSITPYLHFDGNAEIAMNWYKSIFGGTFNSVQRYKDMAGGIKLMDEDRDRLIHISLQISADLCLMASDFLSSMETPQVRGNNVHICIQAESEMEAEKLFNELSAGGSIEMPLNRTFWGAYFGMCRDRFNVGWMINCNPNA